MANSTRYFTKQRLIEYNNAAIREKGVLDMTLERFDMLPTAIWDEKEQELRLETESEINLERIY